MHSKPLASFYLGTVDSAIQHLSVVFYAHVLLSFAVPAMFAKPPAFECLSKIARLSVVEAPCIGHSTMV